MFYEIFPASFSFVFRFVRSIHPRFYIHIPLSAFKLIDFYTFLMVNSSNFLCHSPFPTHFQPPDSKGVNKRKNENQFHVIINSKETWLDDELILPPIFLIAPTEGRTNYV